MIAYKKNIFIFIFLTFVIIQTNAQRWKNSGRELIFGFGATNFLGDIGGGETTGNPGFSDLNIEATSYLINVGYNVTLSRFVSLQADFYYGEYTADDSYSLAQSSRGRKFSIKSPIFELSPKLLIGYPFEKLGRRHYQDELGGEKNIQITPYLFFGVGLFYMNPMGKYIDNEWYSLQPLCTEGQDLAHYPTRTKYNRLQISFPFGIGFKTLLTENWFLGVDFGIRKTFTDYMDDVSLTYPNYDYLNAAVGPVAAYFSSPTDSMLNGAARGGANYNDSYMFLTISFRYKLREMTKTETKHSPGRRKDRKRMKRDW